MQTKRRVLCQKLNLETCAPPPKGRLLLRLLRIPTFLCSLKVKGTVNRIVGAFGLRDKFSTTSSMRRNLIDYYGTRFPDGTSSLFFSTMRRLTRLLRYSISGWDQLPIFLDHEKTYSTTTVLEPQMGLVPYIFLDHEKTHSTTTVLEPRICSSSLRRPNRLLKYSISGWDQFLIFLDQ